MITALIIKDVVVDWFTIEQNSQVVGPVVERRSGTLVTEDGSWNFTVMHGRRVAA